MRAAVEVDHGGSRFTGDDDARSGVPRLLLSMATYHQIWWPQADEARFEGDRLPVWNDGVGYVDPDTGEVLSTWDEALDQLGDEPMQVDVKGVLAGSSDADQCIRYLSRYLTKSLGEILDGQAQREHAARFVDALRYANNRG